MGHDVVITGMGAVCTCGTGVEALWRDVVAGTSLATWSEPLANGQRVPVYPAPEAIVPSHLAEHARHMDRAAVYGLIAADEAAKQARLVDAIDPARLGVVMGTARGPVGVLGECLEREHAGKGQRPSRLSPGSVTAISGCVASAFGALGAAFTVSAACASGAHAIAIGAGLIQSGAAEVVLAGGADAVLHPALLSQFAAAGILGRHEDPALACRPFDVTRNGTIFGEGAGVLVLESAASASSRGARVLATLEGWALGSEPGARTNVSDQGEALQRVMRQGGAAACFGVDGGYVNAHGTGTLANDAAEARAILNVLGASVAVGSTKGVTGHCAGATPALEAIVCIQAMHEGIVPVSANCGEWDPDCAVRIVRETAPWRGPKRAWSTSLGFWGVAACLQLGMGE